MRSMATKMTKAAVAAALAASMTCVVMALPGCSDQQTSTQSQQEERQVGLVIKRGDATRTYLVSQSLAEGAGAVNWGKDTFQLGVSDSGAITCTYKGKTITCCDGDDATLESGKVTVRFDKDFNPPTSEQEDADVGEDGAAVAGSESDEDMSDCTSESCDMRNGGECNCEAGEC